MLSLCPSDSNAHGSILIRNLRNNECNHLYENILVLFMCRGLKKNLRWTFECHTSFGNEMITTQNL